VKTDGLFTTHSFTIPIRRHNPVTILLFGDIHRDSPLHAGEAWQKFLTRVKDGLARREELYLLGMGDYLDSTSSSERECLETAKLYLHDTMKKDLHAMQEAKVELLAKELKFAKGRIIGLLGGNHYWMFKDQTSTDQRLAGLLDCNYLGVSSFIRLTFQYNNQRKTLDIFGHHGKGSGRLPGGSINTLDQMREYAEADVFAMGHDHKRSVTPATPKLYLTHTKSGLDVKSRQQWLVRSGSFLKSFGDGLPSYNVDACRGPCSIGWVELEIMPVFKGKKSCLSDLDIHGRV
jgi:predicted phosphodiesterase